MAECRWMMPGFVLDMFAKRLDYDSKTSGLGAVMALFGSKKRRK